MTTPGVASPTAAAWEGEARRLEPLVDGLSAVVLVGSDPASVAEIAVELGRAQAVRRRVTIGDLVGELPALEALIAHDDPHGLSDALAYGVSLGRIGHPVAGVHNLFVAPSGTDSVVSEAILTHPRWARIVAGVRAKGGLLLLVADPKAPGVNRLIDATDGAIVVGDAAIEGDRQVIARTPPRGVRRAGGMAGGKPRRVPSRAVLAGAAAGLALAIALIALAPRDDGPAAPTPAAAPAADPPPAVENPDEEDEASAYSLVLLTANTLTGATDNLQRMRDLPAATMAPSLDGTGIWYKVLAGAYPEAAQAESLRTALHEAGRVSADMTSIAALPFALLVADSVPADSMVARAATFREQGIPAYPLRQPDGGGRIFAGAFATPEEAMHLAPLLRSAGLRPRIAFRTGRPL